MLAIEELYYGNISPCERFAKSTGKYQKLSKELLNLENMLLEELNKSNRELLETMFELRCEQESILEKDMFINGFRLGAQLVFDILSPYDSEFE